jgi:superfamily II DNA or RNA helicase
MSDKDNDYIMDAALEAFYKSDYLNDRHGSIDNFRPGFIYNDVSKKKKVLDTIENELAVCNKFYFSVAFITDSGISELKQALKEAEENSIPGKIITTDYLCFSEPKALRELMQYKNIELRMFHTDKDIGFHTKGYIFRNEEIYKIIIGSSNLTQNALCQNKEWNSKLVSTQNGSFGRDVIDEFANLWDKSQPVSQCIDEYEAKYKEKQKKEIEESQEFLSHKVLVPNEMQKDFIANFTSLINEGATKGLLISSTGTGKTYASAFAIREMQPKRVLYVAHREQILTKSMGSYQEVLGKDVQMGLLSGNSRPESSCTIVFSTINMMAKDNVLTQYKKDEFDFIVIDEVHRAGADSYKKIMAYFQPKFCLGMTATPERTDGQDIFKMFDNNIVYEIRLAQALSEDLLCPFHYFGITDFQYKGSQICDDSNLKNFNLLVSDERVRYIIKEAEYYGYSGKKVKGLAFCSDIKECQILSEKFNAQGYKTVALSANNTQQEREEAVERLEADPEQRNDYLDYIFTVDIFNEGIDIPSVNQVLLLRPTQSVIVFVQQLGRGLRKAKGKEYVVIVDFIGNYNNNYMIPIALNGDNSGDKDAARSSITQGNKTIPGCSSIHFDEITKKKIYDSIDNADFGAYKILKESYLNLKAKLGRIPHLYEFEKYNAIDPVLFLCNNSFKSYYSFLKRADTDYKPVFNEADLNILSFISFELSEGKRIYELLLIKELLEDNIKGYSNFLRDLKSKYSLEFTSEKKASVISVLNGSFNKGKDIRYPFIEEENGGIRFNRSFEIILQNKDYFNMVKETVDYGIHSYENKYSKHNDSSDFVLNEKYTYKDVARLLCYDKNPNALNVGGYKYDQKTNTYTVYINYQKDPEISDTTKYEDTFINESQLLAYSKSKRTINSPDMLEIKNAEKNKTPIYLFMRKSNNDKGEKNFYYLGKMKYENMEQTKMPADKTEVDVVKITYALEEPVRDDIFDYLTTTKL